MSDKRETSVRFQSVPSPSTFSFRNGKRSLLEEVGPNQHHRRAGGRVMDPNLGIFLLFHKKSELAFFFFPGIKSINDHN